MSTEETQRYRRARGLRLTWIEGDPRRHRVERPDAGVEFAIGARALALLESFGAGEEAGDVLASLIPGDAPREEQDRWFRAMETLVDSGLLTAVGEEGEIGGSRPFPPFPGLGQWNYHFRMVTDHRRVLAYRQAIDAAIRPGMTVVDVGTGTGILAVMAAKAGANVVAIERTDAIEMARRVVEASGVSDRVRLIRGDSRSVVIEERADLVLSEMVGNHVLDENLLELTLDARRRFCRPGAASIPRRLIVLAWPVSFPEPENYRKVLGRAESATGVDLSPFTDWMNGRLAAGDAVVELDAGTRNCPRLGEASVLAEIDLESFEEPRLDGDAVLHIDRPGELSGILVAFDLRMWDDIRLDNRPDRPPTHWKTPLYPVPDPFEVTPGDLVPIRAKYRPGGDLQVGLAPAF